MVNHMSNPSNEKKISVKISVNGQSIEDDYPPNQPIQAAVKQSLTKTNHTVDLSTYNVTVDGEPLDVNQTFSGAGLKDGDCILVSNKPGKKA